MLGNIIKKIIGTKNDREVSRLKKLVNQINQFESALEVLSDEELSNQTNVFRTRLEAGETLDSLLSEAFATVREASKRVMGYASFLTYK